MPVWRSQSRPGRQALLSLVCGGVGLVLVVKFWNMPDQTMSDARAVMGLGVLLLVIGTVSLVATGRQTVVVDPRTRLITIADLRLIGTKTRSIPFGDIVNIRIGYLGKASNFAKFYSLVLQLTSGEEYQLFAPGRFYQGGADRFIVEGWRRRLEEYLRR